MEKNPNFEFQIEEALGTYFGKDGNLILHNIVTDSPDDASNCQRNGVGEYNDNRMDFTCLDLAVQDAGGSGLGPVAREVDLLAHGLAPLNLGLVSCCVDYAFDPVVGASSLSELDPLLNGLGPNNVDSHAHGLVPSNLWRRWPNDSYVNGGNSQVFGASNGPKQVGASSLSELNPLLNGGGAASHLGEIAIDVGVETHRQSSNASNEEHVTQGHEVEGVIGAATMTDNGDIDLTNELIGEATLCEMPIAIMEELDALGLNRMVHQTTTSKGGIPKKGGGDRRKILLRHMLVTLRQVSIFLIKSQLS
ncbi:Env [Sesbania bispinosa]|nr:Env [Sesbania bispinosa]